MTDRALAHLRTPPEAPWTERVHGSGGDGDPRDPFERDRDRVLHCESFRRLQHKTQVLVVTEGDAFSTRLLHSIETAQIGRTIAETLGLNECLAEAICLGHDVGHTPFGHMGEETIKELLDGVAVWDSNAHSLDVLQSLEKQYPEFDGLDLTWATREGIARHKTVFDVPATEYGTSEFSKFVAPSPECQVANAADEIAYLTHDVHDALQYGIVTSKELSELGISLFSRNWTIADGEMRTAHPEDWHGAEQRAILYRRTHGLMIGAMVNDAIAHSASQADAAASLEEARKLLQPVVGFSEKLEAEKKVLVEFMMSRMYKSPLVARQNAKAARVLTEIFGQLTSDTRLLPYYVQKRIGDSGGGSDAIKRQTALFIASLTDRGAIDLYNELFTPSDRAMGHHVQ